MSTLTDISRRLGRRLKQIHQERLEAIGDEGKWKRTQRRQPARAKVLGGPSTLKPEPDAQRIVDTVIDTTAELYGVTRAQILGRQRPRRVANARQVAMTIARELSGLSTIELAELFYKNDHGTILHACRAVQNACDVYPEIRHQIANLRAAVSRALRTSTPTHEPR